MRFKTLIKAISLLVFLDGWIVPSKAFPVALAMEELKECGQLVIEKSASDPNYGNIWAMVSIKLDLLQKRKVITHGNPLPLDFDQDKPEDYILEEKKVITRAKNGGQLPLDSDQIYPGDYVLVHLTLTPLALTDSDFQPPEPYQKRCWAYVMKKEGLVSTPDHSFKHSLTNGTASGSGPKKVEAKTVDSFFNEGDAIDLLHFSFSERDKNIKPFPWKGEIIREDIERSGIITSRLVVTAKRRAPLKEDDGVLTLHPDGTRFTLWYLLGACTLNCSSNVL